jgi:hypothetical protein
MEIKNPRFDQLDDGTPVLKLTLNGVEAEIDPYQKPHLLEHGIITVTLPPDRQDLLPSVEVPGDALRGIPSFSLDCCATTDETVLRLTRRFIEAVKNDTFKPGPVKL